MRLHFILFVFVFSVAGMSCNNDHPRKTASSAENSASSQAVSTPVFNADTAYDYIVAQLSFGPRVPGSAAQAKCAGWMESMLEKFSDTVYKQDVMVKAGNGKMLPCINLIGVIHPKATHRILLLTHWDSRPWADEDSQNVDKPIMAADDAGSGVAVLLELARQVKAQKLPENLGIDILLEDVEDFGKTEWGEASYCLGTQYWATHPHVPGYKADFGILLDMVGAKGAVFPMEGTSAQFAGDIQQKMYAAASRAGYSSFFPFGNSQHEITDDHLFVNRIAHIPTIDIINLTGNPFAPHWHTHKDNIDIIDKTTLKAVGQSLLQVIYESGSNM